MAKKRKDNKRKDREGKIGVHVYINRDFHEKIKEKYKKEDIDNMSDLVRSLLREYLKDGK